MRSSTLILLALLVALLGATQAAAGTLLRPMPSVLENFIQADEDDSEDDDEEEGGW